MSGFIRVNGRHIALDAVIDSNGQYREAMRVTPDAEDDDVIEPVLSGLDLDDPEDDEGDDEPGSP